MDNESILPLPPEGIAVRSDNEETTEIDAGFVHKGIRIKGIEFLEDAGVLERGDVTTLLDKLPDGFFQYVPLGSINFENYKVFTLERDGKLMVKREDEINHGDVIRRRARGMTNWNSEVVDGSAVPTDGQMTIQIFSPLDFSLKEENQTDKDVAMITLAHELGHATWGMMYDYPRYVQYLASIGRPKPRELCPVDYTPLVEAWKSLPESQILRFQQYREHFLREREREETGKVKTSAEDLTTEEDFAVAHEHFLHSRDLGILDSNRHGLIDLVYETIDLPLQG